MSQVLPTLTVTADRNYSVEFTDSWHEVLTQELQGRTVLVFAPEQLMKEIESRFRPEEIVITPDGEAAKSVASFSRYIEEVAKRGLDRRSVLVGIGGGATTDLVGFLAATYMRGIEWIAVPTTVAGMVDASIGGKTGINLESGKNLAGAFYSPSRVIIDFRWLDSLSMRDINAGLAESVKCGFIADAKILDLIEKDATANLAEIVHRSVAVKASVVSTDFRESYQREALNYGHTLGHAIERDSNYQLRHGEAVSIGLVFAAKVSERFSGLDPQISERHSAILNLLALPTTYNADAWHRLVELMYLDKKRTSEKLRFVTLAKLGETQRVEVSPVKLEIIYKEVIGR